MALLELNVRNFAIIKQLELEVDSGLTVITGETGAGKSIVLGSLNLLLGSRAEAEMIRHGEDSCEVSALFSIQDLKEVCDWLKNKDLAAEDEAKNYCLIRRVVRTNKPTKCYINDKPTTLASLKELGKMLIDIHGQHEHQSLLRVASQRKIIDQFAGNEDALLVMSKLAVQINQVEKKLSTMNRGHSDNSERMELLSFQLSELDEACPLDSEFEELEQEHTRLSNAQDLISGIEAAAHSLFHNEVSNVSSELGNSVNSIAELVEFDANLLPANELLNSALAQVQEAQSELESALSKIDIDPERLNEVEQRRDTLINLARKHRCGETVLPSKHQELQDQYKRLEAEHFQPEKLKKELEKLSANYTKIAHAVSDKRQEVAGQLSALISEQMQNLGMKGGKLSIEVEPQFSDDVLVSEHGIDHIEFMVSTNHGMPLKALHKTASGGELSRISLAIQVIASEKSDTPTLVFDEVDVGVGGKIAQIVGESLKSLGENAQVICITHLPQVAVQGEHHVYIDKVTTQTETYSNLIKLNDDLRTAEIARMLGGADITERTRAHAQEMLNSKKAV